MNLLKKGAMFGLDARIALAIFGALSVISGAALYSAIQSAKSEQWRQYFVEVVKATEAYYLDNFKQISINSTSNYYLYTGDLFNNRESLSTWQGPYVPANSAASYFIRDNTTNSFFSDANLRIYLRQGSDWLEMNDLTADEICVINDHDCYEWISLYSGNTATSEVISNLQNIFTQLDNLVDNGDGELKGKIRYNTHGHNYLMYQGMPHKRTS